MMTRGELETMKHYTRSVCVEQQFLKINLSQGLKLEAINFKER